MKLIRRPPVDAPALKPFEAGETMGPATAVSEFPVLRVAVFSTVLVMLALVSYLIGQLFLSRDLAGVSALLGETFSDRMFWSAVLVGLVAQAVDGALGMAYGVTSTAFLLSLGATPATASASVHIAELFTTGVSGVSHAKLGNVDKRLFLRLLLPGISGAVLGVLLVTQIDAAVMKPFISAYLVIMGLYILSKAWRTIRPRKTPPRHVGKLALFGGFVDAAGGGGWGPVVTTTLVGSGNDVRTTIGSVNFAEFFLALATAGSFALLAGSGIWVIVAGLVLGGLCAAPFAAYMTRRLHARTLLILVGVLVTLVSAWSLYRALV